MDWTNELKQLENEVRTLPAEAMSMEKHQEIYRVLQGSAANTSMRGRKRRIRKIGLSAACVAAVAVLAVGGYDMMKQSGGSLNSVVTGASEKANTAPKAAIYTLPAVGNSEHWAMELQPSFADQPASTPSRPRYDYILTYKGQGANAEHVVVEEHGVGIWKPDGTIILTETRPVGTLSNGRHNLYENFTALDAVPNLFFKITWTESGKTQTEEITIPRK
ncbi:hypothetical protein JJB07_12200 [Tumebacillus sp. ITR2]|uniref:DUF4367 domain-containing protein n=1 Tax=Tumebacillus amylolyticus TaxID=2801339 RepID=A0ABS1JAV6_9BACL|nr:hypothetical protein [Tumebacillus amylolyticus]MBL0387415.1 hypothetical protein [Tumebacillus amylolyticus]